MVWDGCYRRMFLFAAHTGEGPLTDPTTAAQPRRRELLFMAPQQSFFSPVVAIVTGRLSGGKLSFLSRC